MSPRYYPLFTMLLAQAQSVPSAEIWQPLANAGAMGVITAFFMWQFSKKEDERNAVLRDLTKALNANSNALMVAVLALKNGDSNISELAQKIADDTKPRT